MGHEAFPLYGRLAVLDAGCDMDLVAGVPCRTSHGQTVRQEVPVLGHDVEQAGSHSPALVSARHRLRNSRQLNVRGCG